MRRIAGYLLVLFAILSPPLQREASALSVGSPAMPVDLGGTVLSGSIGYSALEIDDMDVESKSFLLKSSFGVTEGVSPYLRFGFADLSADGGFEGNLGFAYGGGVLLELVRPQGDNGLVVGLDAQVLWTSSKEAGDTRRLFHGQAALLGAVRSGGTVGYGGLATSFVNVGGDGPDLEENGQGHLFFGVDYFMDFNFYVNIEAHLFGEDSLALGVGYKF